MRCVRSLCGAITVAVLPLSAQIAQAENVPAFRAGIWQFDRTVEGGPTGKRQILTGSRCANPTEDMKRQREKFLQSGCKFSSVARSGPVYSYTAQCTIQGVSGESKSALTVESDSAYSLRVESRYGPQTSIEVLKALRTGDCAK